ncbi:MAG: hypothetical protein V4732_17685 [Pseudomonadota bacterium]
MKVQDYRVDGLRLDAVHAISEKNFLVEFATRVRATAPDREIHFEMDFGRGRPQHFLKDFS